MLHCCTRIAFACPAATPALVACRVNTLGRATVPANPSCFAAPQACERGNGVRRCGRCSAQRLGCSTAVTPYATPWSSRAFALCPARVVRGACYAPRLSWSLPWARCSVRLAREEVKCAVPVSQTLCASRSHAAGGQRLPDELLVPVILAPGAPSRANVRTLFLVACGLL